MCPPSLLKEMMWGHATAQIHSRAIGPSDAGDSGWSRSTVTKVTQPVCGQTFTAEWHSGYGRKAHGRAQEVNKDRLI